MKRLLKKIFTKETMLYLFFGVLTSIVSYVSFLLAKRLLGELYTLLANAISFVLAVAFAYITNKVFVFNSKSFKWDILRKEIPIFFGARMFSFALEEFGLFIAAHVLHWGELIIYGLDGIDFAKLGLTILVVIINYFFSKLLVFKNNMPKNVLNK